MVTSLQATTSAPMSFADTSGVTAESRTNIGEGAPDPFDAYGTHAVAFGTGLPSVTDVINVITTPNVDSSFDVGGTSDILGMVVLGGQNVDGSGATTYTSKVGFSLDLSGLGHSQQDLLVGILDPFVKADGFDSLDFQIFKEGALAFSKSCTDLACALGFFSDNVLDLGAIGSGVSGDLDLLFQLDLVASGYDFGLNEGDGFSFNLIFGNAAAPVPLPAAVWLFGSGLLGLFGITRREKLS